MRLKVKMNDVNTGKIDALDPSMPPVDVLVSGVTKQYSYVFVGVCEDRYIKKKSPCSQLFPVHPGPHSQRPSAGSQVALLWQLQV